MKNCIPSLLIAACAAWSVFPAIAEKADKNKPMNIESDALRYDDQNQTSTFTGNVVVTKGTLVMRGTRLDVRQDPEGYQYGQLTAEPGKRAFYRQKREAVDEYIEGEGEVINYDGRADTAVFTRQAEMRRYRGTKLSDDVTGDVIVYNNTTDVYTVDRAPAPPAVPGQPAAPAGRVRAMLAPREAAPAAPAAPANAVPLRPSTTLGGGARP